MKKIITFLFIIAILVSCKQENQPNAQDIINKAIEVSGGTNYEASTISFDFRDKHYKAIRNNGMFELSREFKDSINVIKDILSNNGFQRFISDELIEVADSMIPRYSSSVNSVHYFTVLPFGLNDSAVIKTLISEVSINEDTYYKIKVTFNQDGGGDDFEDVFVYWLNNKNYKLDYLAYLTYNRDRSIDLRFREAYNERFVNGIRFVDYNNYKPNDMSVDLLNLDAMFINNELKLLSKIENKNISVK
jgi:hypothetical protein